MKKLLIYGCGGHARSIADVAISNQCEKIYFTDQNARANEHILGFPANQVAQTNVPCIIGIGDNHSRAAVFADLISQQAPLVPVIADSAHIGKEAIIEIGTFVAAGAHIGPETFIDQNTIINTQAVIEHNCRIGKHTHISVNATIAGKSEVGDFVMIGTGATVIDNVRICSNVIIGAGAVVVADITEPGTYVGVPARRVHKAGHE